MSKRLVFEIVFVVALLTRLAFVAGTSKGQGELGGDAGDYHAYAMNLSNHGIYQNAEGYRASRMPGYPAMLALQYSTERLLRGHYLRLDGEVLITQLWQCLLGALTCLLVVALAGRWWGYYPWGLVAGLLASVSFDLAEPCARILTESSIAFFLTLTLWLMDQSSHGRTGISAACTYLLRPEFLPWSVLVALYQRWRMPWRAWPMILIVPGFVMALWMARNQAVLGRSIATTTAGSFNLYGWGIPRTIEERMGGPMWERSPEKATEVERETFYGDKIRQFFRKSRYLAITKAFLLNVCVTYYPFSPGLDVTFLFMAPFFLAGLCVTWRDQRMHILGFTVAYLTLVYAVAGVMIPRHRQSFGTFTVLLAVAGIRHLYRKMDIYLFCRIIGIWSGICIWSYIFGPYIRIALLKTIAG